MIFFSIQTKRATLFNIIIVSSTAQDVGGYFGGNSSTNTKCDSRTVLSKNNNSAANDFAKISVPEKKNVDGAVRTTEIAAVKVFTLSPPRVFARVPSPAQEKPHNRRAR